jgi:microcystin-dependent protein
MAYNKTVWVNGGTPAINATNLNNMEAGIYNLDRYEVGEIKIKSVRKIPNGYPFLLCEGQAISRTTYEDLFEFLCFSETFTVTIASPAVFTVSGGHVFKYGDRLRFTTTGALPTGLTAGTDYYVQNAGLTSTQFRVSTSVGGSDVNTSGSQSGVHTSRIFNDGVGDGSTTFNVPDYRGVVLRGVDDGKTYDTNRVLGSYQADGNKAHTHTGTTASDGAHTHTVGSYLNTGGSSSNCISTNNNGNTAVTANSDGNHTHTFTSDSSGNTEATVKNKAVSYWIRY